MRRGASRVFCLTSGLACYPFFIYYKDITLFYIVQTFSKYFAEKKALFCSSGNETSNTLHIFKNLCNGLQP